MHVVVVDERTYGGNLLSVGIEKRTEVEDVVVFVEEDKVELESRGDIFVSILEKLGTLRTTL